MVVNSTNTENKNVQIGSAIANDYPFQYINKAAKMTPIDYIISPILIKINYFFIIY